MKQAVLALVALVFAPMPVVRAADVTIVRAFPADKGPGYRKPAPDAAGAVGPRHAVTLDDRAFVAVDKETGIRRLWEWVAANPDLFRKPRHRGAPSQVFLNDSREREQAG